MGIFGRNESKPPESAPRPHPSAPPAPPRPTAAPQAATPCVIGPGTTVKGDVTGDEDIVVEGVVEGTIQITRRLHVGPGGRVKANVRAESVIVAGDVVGDCQAAHRVQIEATGRLTGNIRAPSVVIVEGASFKGNSEMSPGAGAGRPRSA